MNGTVGTKTRERLAEPPFVAQFGRDDAERRLANRENEDVNAPEWNWCGLCCLRSVLLSLGRTEPDLPALYDAAHRAGVFRWVGGEVHGAFHHELAAFAREHLGFARGWTARGWTAADVANQVYGLDPQYVIASVSPQIRHPDGPPPARRNGHLVLVYGVEETQNGKFLVLHNSAGFVSLGTDRAVRVPQERFNECFSGNVIVVDDAPWRRTQDREPDVSDDPALFV